MVLEPVHPDVLESQNRTRAKHGHPGENEDKDKALSNNWLALLELGSESMAQSGLQEPINGLDQAVDHLIGKNLLPQVSLIPTLDDERLGSPRWFADVIGSGVGSILPFLLTERFTHGVGETKLGSVFRETLDDIPGARAIAGLNQSNEYVSHLAKSSLDGAIYGGILVPSYDGDKGFWQQRSKDALAVSITFGTQDGVSHGVLNGLEKSGLGHMDFHHVEALTAKSITTRMGSNLIGGSTAGLVGVETTSLLYGLGPATPDEIKKSVASFAVTGFTLDIAHLTQEKILANKNSAADSDRTPPESELPKSD